MQLFTCRGCALLCQNVATGEFAACPQADFSPSPALSPQLAGKSVTLEQALAHVAERLRCSHAPLLFTSGAAVAETRALLAVAKKIQATVDVVGSAAYLDRLQVWQRQRIYQTTLTELRQRADVVCVIGAGIAEKMPYFYRDFIAPSPQFSKQRKVIFIGKTASFENHLHLSCETTQFPQLFSLLLALLKGKKLEAAVYELPEYSQVLELINWIKNANYAVITWLDGDLGEHADLTQSMLYQIMAYLAKQLPIMGLALMDNPEIISFTQVSTWSTGFPFRYQFTEHGIQADNWKYAGTRIVAQRESDVVLFVGDYTKYPIDFNEIPAIVFDTSGNADRAHHAAAWIPVGKTGLDCAGQLFRADQGSVVALDAFWKDSSVPSVASVFEALSTLL